MNFSQEETILILKAALEKFKNDPESFYISEDYGDTSYLRSKNRELYIKKGPSKEGGPCIVIELNGALGKIRRSIFNSNSWKAFSMFKEIYQTLKFQAELKEKSKRLKAIHEFFPEIVAEEFEKQILIGDINGKENSSSN